MRTIFLILLIIPLTACGSLHQQLIVNSPVSSISDFEEKIPGRYALYIGDSYFDRGGVAWFTCGPYISYVMNPQPMFHESVRQTLDNLVEDLVVVDAPIPAKQLAQQDFDRQIVVVAEDMYVDTSSKQHFWTADVNINVDMTATLEVYGPEETVLQQSFSSKEEAAGSIVDCNDAKSIFVEATSKSMEEVMRGMGNALSKTTRLARLEPN